MAVPDFQTLMLPVLRQFADGSERGLKDAADPIQKEFQLSAVDIAETLPSGRQTRFRNRLAWAHNYLKQSGLLESPRRGVYRLTTRGRTVLASPPKRIDIAFLEQYPEFIDFRSRTAETSESSAPQIPESVASAVELTPDEQIRGGYERQRVSLAAQLLERVRQASPAFFEDLVVELLVAMGYGGTHEDAARVVGRSGDGGIDGIIKEDRLGLESIYIQAKRWKDGSTVGRPDIQQFAGALQGQRARKGVFITTSRFSDDAKKYAEGLQTSIVLVDGPQLAQLMIDYGIGVSAVETLRLMRLDEDYFGEE
jgi:restriction system protein